MEQKKTSLDFCERLGLFLFIMSTILVIIIIAVETFSAQSRNDFLNENPVQRVPYEQNKTLEKGILAGIRYPSTAQRNGIPREHVSKETSFEKRTNTVKMGKEETLLILKSYLKHATKWKDILRSVKENIDKLPQAAKELYQAANAKQLRDRMKAKIKELINQQAENIDDLDIRLSVQDIKVFERILGKRKAFQPKRHK